MAAECAADQLLGGRYALVEVLGHGASGVVWRARDQLLHRDVAVKEIRFPVVAGRGAQADLREAILREARAAARLNHPGAVTVYDVVEDDGRPLIVMELVDAPTLAELVERSGPLPPAEVAAIGAELLDALDAGHAAGIVHRDVKPGNVMVDESSGRVRLADFGVASVLDDARITSGGAMVGSPAYMAPEQVTGEEIGRPADMWALGATLYFAVEGRPPYDKGTAVPTMMAIVREPPRPPVRAGTLGPLLEALLDKDPAARPTAPFLRLWLAEVAGGAAGAEALDATSQFPVLPSDIEVPPGPGGPMGPGPTGPGGPVVIPKPTPPEAPVAHAAAVAGGAGAGAGAARRAGARAGPADADAGATRRRCRRRRRRRSTRRADADAERPPHRRPIPRRRCRRPTRSPSPSPIPTPSGCRRSRTRWSCRRSPIPWWCRPPPRR